jgi:aarF domain-containing kinase
MLLWWILSHADGLQVMGKLVLGGTSGISMGGLTLQLESVAREYQMVIPPYFALVLRAFSVIEGIAMSHDPNYNIVGSCFPYLSRRLLTDNHPRMRAALRSLLYGTGSRLDVDRLKTLMSALNKFTVGPRVAPAGPTFADAYGAALEEERVKRAPWEGLDEVVVDDNMKDVLRAVFSKDGNYLQVPCCLPCPCVLAVLGSDRSLQNSCLRHGFER